jgi:hypothetical protein
MPNSSKNALSIMASLSVMGHSPTEIGEVIGMTRERVRDALNSQEGHDATTALTVETKRQIFDPVQRKLESFAADGVQELWDMREEVESETLKAKIITDVIHMAGYRPHTNTDKKAEDLPTIVIGQMSINPGTPSESNLPLAVPSTYTEVSDGTQEEQDPRGADDSEPIPQECFLPEAAEDDAGNQGIARWPLREIQRSKGETGGEREGDSGTQQASAANGTPAGSEAGREK